MDKLTEHQFHTVWTTAVGKEGYDKRLFQNLFEELEKKNLIIKNKSFNTNLFQKICVWFISWGISGLIIIPCFIISAIVLFKVDYHHKFHMWWQEEIFDKL